MTKEMMVLMATAFPTPEQIGGFTPEQIGGFTLRQIGWFTPEQIGGFTLRQIGWFTPEQIGWFTLRQIGGFTPEQIGWFTLRQIGGFTPEQIGWFTPEQIETLNLAHNIPKINRLYSRILDGIESEKRRLNQSTFGPETDPKNNLCNTPMCIAGHTVNLAGEAGYALMRKVGFELAARLLHVASRPDVSCPRYDSYPSEWALAYIEARAAEELAK